jgi:hypothetical protein
MEDEKMSDEKEEMSPEKWAALFDQVRAEINELPEDLRAVVPDKFTVSGDEAAIAKDYDELVAGPAYLAEKDVLLLLNIHSRALASHYLLLQLMKRTPPDPAFSFVMEMLGDSNYELGALLRRELPEDEWPEFIM